jgi:Tfp pilus assembly protein PilO
MILSVIGIFVILLAFFFLFIRPRQQELARVEESIVTEEARTQQLETELARLQDLQANAPELQAELATIRGFVPEDDQVPNFIFLVQDAANEAGVDFVSITPELPKPPPEGAALAEIRAQIGAGGGYFAVQDFIRRLHALDRAVRIDNLTLAGAEDPETGDVRITLTSAARIFFELPGGTAAAVDPATGLPAAPPATPAPTPTS